MKVVRLISLSGSTLSRSSSLSNSASVASARFTIRVKERALSDGTLVALGWTDELEAAFITYEERGFRPARVVAEHRGGYLVRSAIGDRLAQARGRCATTRSGGGCPRSATGSSSVTRPATASRSRRFCRRRTKVSRKTPWLKAEEHSSSRTSTPSCSFRARRGLQPSSPRALPHRCVGQRRRSRHRAHEARPLRRSREARRGGGLAVGVPVFAVSNVTGEGIDAIRGASATAQDVRPPRLVRHREVDAREPARREDG